MTTLAQIVLSSSREELQMPVCLIVNGVRKPFRSLVVERVTNEQGKQPAVVLLSGYEAV